MGNDLFETDELEHGEEPNDDLQALHQFLAGVERRALRLLPQNLSVVQEADDQLLLSFDLSVGSFATSVLREICQVENAQRGEF